MPRSPEPRILVVGDAADWHWRRLEAAFAAAGASATRVDLAACGFATASPGGLDLPGFGDAPPDAALVRTMAAGSFEAVTRRLGVLHALEARGVVVWNPPLAIERCVDKSTTSFRLARCGAPTPASWAVESREAAAEIVARESAGGPLVLKPLFGAQGKGLRLIRSAGDLPAPEAVAGVYYLQRFEAVEGAEFRDFRLFVVAGEVAAAMMRRSPNWITNVKQGGEPVAFRPDAAMRRLAEAAAEAVGARIAGVDILIARDGAPTVLEVNSMPAWSGLQKVTSVDVAARIAGALLARIRGEAAPG